MGEDNVSLLGSFDSFDTVLAIKTHLDTHSDYIKVHLKGKKYQRYIESLLYYLLTHNEDRRKFLEYGGIISTIVDDLGNVQKLVVE